MNKSEFNELRAYVLFAVALSMVPDNILIKIWIPIIFWGFILGAGISMIFSILYCFNLPEAGPDWTLRQSETLRGEDNGQRDFDGC